jgi:spermidine synthase
MSAIQSRMKILEPDALELEYTRLMMGFLLLHPRPLRLAMIGLGGGSLAKFCHRFLPLAQMVVVEVNAEVIALREMFHVPADGARFRVVCADGARFVAETAQRFDVLMLDAFDPTGMPAALGSQRFYDDCADALAPGGVLVANLHAGHPLLPAYLDRIAASFGGPVLRIDDRDGSNCVVFACKGDRLRRGSAAGAARRPAVLEAGAWPQLRDAFARIGHAWRVRDEAPV